jgi:hypothetical protein
MSSSRKATHGKKTGLPEGRRTTLAATNSAPRSRWRSTGTSSPSAPPGPTGKILPTTAPCTCSRAPGGPGRRPTCSPPRLPNPTTCSATPSAWPRTAPSSWRACAARPRTPRPPRPAPSRPSGAMAAPGTPTPSCSPATPAPRTGSPAPSLSPGDGSLVAVGSWREDGSSAGVNGAPDEDASNAGAVYVGTR